MAAITDPRAITFSNQQLRVFADLLMSCYRAAVVLQQNWNTQGLSALFPNDSSIVEDGASKDGVDAIGGDGRPLMHGTDANNLLNRAFSLQSWMERNTLDGSGIVTDAVLNTIVAVSVNGRSPF